MAKPVVSRSSPMSSRSATVVVTGPPSTPIRTTAYLGAGRAGTTPGAGTADSLRLSEGGGDAGRRGRRRGRDGALDGERPDRVRGRRRGRGGRPGRVAGPGGGRLGGGQVREQRHRPGQRAGP